MGRAHPPAPPARNPLEEIPQARPASDPSLILQNDDLSRNIDAWLDKLSGKQSEIVARRFGLRGHGTATLEDVGKEVGLTREREVDHDPRPFVAGLRDFAHKNDVALADASLRYGRLWRQGIPYNALMLNAINHPDARGMKIFADALMELFR